MKPDEYTLPQHLKFIKIFIYVDLLINIIYQVPIQVLHEKDGRNGWQRVIGLFSFGYIDPNTKEMTFQNIGVVITKSIMFCLVLLLDSLVKSPAYKQFKEEKLKHFQEISMFKSRCLTYLYNNNKLRKIVKIQYEKDAMIQKIKLMKKQLSLWNKKYLNPDNLNEIRHHSILGLLDRHARTEEPNPSKLAAS